MAKKIPPTPMGKMALLRQMAQNPRLSEIARHRSTVAADLLEKITPK